MKFGKLLARLIVGGLFIGHGTQKWFGGSEDRASTEPPG